MVRDIARSLGKKVRWQLVGEATQVDRDILDLLEAQLGYMLRNALDHGIEAPAVRLARGKPEEGTLTLDARHTAGALLITVSDDGAGIDLDALRAVIVRKKLASEETVARLWSNCSNSCCCPASRYAIRVTSFEKRAAASGSTRCTTSSNACAARCESRMNPASARACNCSCR